jgi:hypothetical protein
MATRREAVHLAPRAAARTKQRLRASTSWLGHAITTTVLVIFTRLNPLWLFAIAGALGLAELV